MDGISSIPADAEEPISSECIIRALVQQVCLSGDMSDQPLKEWARRTKDERLRDPSTSQIAITGFRDNDIASKDRGEAYRDIVFAGRRMRRARHPRPGRDHA